MGRMHVCSSSEMVDRVIYNSSFGSHAEYVVVQSASLEPTHPVQTSPKLHGLSHSPRCRGARFVF